MSGQALPQVDKSPAQRSIAQFGFDYESCKKINPEVVYYSTCMMGQKGPYARKSGYGAYGVAYGGMCSVMGWPDRSPLPFYNNYSDFIAPYYLAGAVALALLRRKKTGKGCYLDQGQSEVGVNHQGPAILDYVVNGHITLRDGNRDPYMAPHGVYPCIGADMNLPCRYVAIAVENDEQWRAFCKVIGEPEWTRDPRFATVLARKENEDELNAIIAEWTIGYTPEQAMFLMQAEGVPAGVVNNNETMVDQDPQLRYREAYQRLQHVEIESFDGLPPIHNAPCYTLSESPWKLYKAGPGLGEDNEYIFKEVLQLTDDEVADAFADGSVTTAEDAPSTWL